MGDPTDPATDLGRLARADLRDTLQRQVDVSVRLGATLATGGRSLSGSGWFYEPTVLLDTRPGMPVFDEETFGPVAAVAVARDEDHAVALANHTAYGLGPQRVERVDRAGGGGSARQITSGAAFVNATVASDPRVPFGGTKRSGYGRELADAGLLAFTNERTYWVAPTPARRDPPRRRVPTYPPPPKVECPVSDAEPRQGSEHSTGVLVGK